MKERFHVINRLNGKKLGDYGKKEAAEERAQVLNAAEPTNDEPVYYVRRYTGFAPGMGAG